MMLLGLGFLFGLFGQALRLLVGLAKYWDQFHWHALRTVIMLIVGGIAGALAAVLFPFGEQLENGEILGYVAAGYAGADFVEGVMSRFLPPPALASPEKGQR